MEEAACCLHGKATETEEGGVGEEGVEEGEDVGAVGDVGEEEA